VDVLRDRYGKNTIMRGSDLKNKKPNKYYGNESQNRH
jgi:hypothetical protein